MFEFYIAAREQKETGHPGIFSRQKHSTIIYVICLLLICLWFAGMVLVGGYARQLWALWIVKAEVTVDAETGAYVGQSKSSKLPPEPDQGFDGRRTNIIWDNTIDMGR